MLSLLDSLKLENFAIDFWQLPITKDFDHQPEFYLGQTVFHCMTVGQGQILHPVEIIGISWSGMDWQYKALLPELHPQFKEEDRECLWLDGWQLETI